MGYMESARTRAARRRSLWNLLLIPCYAVPWLLLIYVSLVGLGHLYAVRHPGSNFRLLPDTAGSILMAVGSLFAWLGPSMIVANVLVSIVPAARRALDLEAGKSGTSRAAANRGLLRVTLYLTPAGVLLALVGAMMPW